MTRPRLSRENVVNTAVRMLDRKGAASLTMRGLAREMDVPLMSLYRHVRSKDDLEAAIVEHLLAGIPTQPRTATWEKSIRNWARSYRAMVREHPNAAPLLASYPAAGYGARAEDAEAMLQAMVDAGMSPARARVSVRAAIVTITGFCNAQAQAEQVQEAPVPDLPDGDFPNLTALIADLHAGRHGDRVFAAMVDSVVAGLEAQLLRSS